MWEKDKKVIIAFRECYKNFIESVRSGEEADYSGVCADETEALTTYTVGQINTYKNNTVPEVHWKRTNYYNPQVPYFQNLWAP